MSTVLRAMTEEDRAWAASRIGISCFLPDARGLAKIGQNGTVFVAIYDGISACDCHMHIASDGSRRWLDRNLMQQVFWYPFVTLGMRRVTGLIGTKNTASLQLAERFGFVREGLKRNALPDDDCYILGLTRSECVLLPKDRRLP